MVLLYAHAGNNNTTKVLNILRATLRIEKPNWLRRPIKRMADLDVFDQISKKTSSKS